MIRRTTIRVIDYVQRGNELLAEKAAQDKANKEAYEQERRERNRQEWLEYLQPVFDSIPSDLHEFVKFDDNICPFEDDEPQDASLDFVPCVPILVCVYRGETKYSVGKVREIACSYEDGVTVPYLRYGYTCHDNAFAAIAAADALGVHNVEWENQLDDPQPAPPATSPLSALEEARLAIHDGEPVVASAWALIVIAEHLGRNPYADAI